MVYKLMLLFIGLIFLSNCNNKEGKTTKNDSVLAVNNETIIESTPIRSTTFIDNVTKKVEDLITKNKYTPFLTLQQQKLDKIEENSKIIVDTSRPNKMTGNQLYYFLKERTMYIGSSYLCERCPNIHLMNASGYVINEEGVIATNYHVIEVKDDVDVSGIFATDYEGNVYPVTQILAASQANDLAILKIDTKGKKVKHIPFAKTELVGEDIFMMGHPYNNLFFMSRGIISRKYISERDDETKVAVTCEFGQGASGGPIVNTNGQLVAMVSGVHPHNASGNEGPTLMVTREAIPVSVLKNYVTIQ
ncbi:S1 family peptidase [Snuella sedimenti]|uniref:Trypsin-like peptidase domain-containing protein n=1 Tax=Snuella sedimenti TaxID=2798802 RepID=A0A8J7LYH6_9FLAO|nr:serine protease [Snuella sedimenti]MBJ6368381.1 trypsin-like peptidase domain-containing protein [Snuella sedimenti]